VNTASPSDRPRWGIVGHIRFVDHRLPEHEATLFTRAPTGQGLHRCFRRVRGVAVIDVVGFAIAVAIWLPMVTFARREVVRRVRRGTISAGRGAIVLVLALALAPWLLWFTGTVQVQPLSVLWFTVIGGIPGYFSLAGVLRGQQPGGSGK